METKKKNKFFTFCLSFLPGAAEMYMGFMKMGISLMCLFFGVITVSALLNIDVLILLIIVIWFYGFFHANNLAGLDDAEFERVKDGFLFGTDTIITGKNNVGKYRKWIAIILIGFGVVLLWNNCVDMLLWIFPNYLADIIWKVNRLVPQTVVGFLIIIAGVRMIGGKQKQLFSEENNQDSCEKEQEENREV